MCIIISCKDRIFSQTPLSFVINKLDQQVNCEELRLYIR
jgi:hypothetical protein